VSQRGIPWREAMRPADPPNRPLDNLIPYLFSIVIPLALGLYLRITGRRHVASSFALVLFLFAFWSTVSLIELVSASPAAITTDDSSTITVTLKDAAGNGLSAGGDTVSVASSLGTVGATTDIGNGTYTAVFTSPVPGTATISATVDGTPIDNNAQVTVEVTQEQQYGVGARVAGAAQLTAINRKTTGLLVAAVARRSVGLARVAAAARRRVGRPPAAAHCTACPARVPAAASCAGCPVHVLTIARHGVGPAICAAAAGIGVALGGCRSSCLPATALPGIHRSAASRGTGGCFTPGGRRLLRRQP